MATIRERLEALKREKERQDQTWERAKQALARLGDARVAVPRELLDEIDGATTQPMTEVVVGIRG